MDYRICAMKDVPDGGSKGFLPNARGRHQAFLVRQGSSVFGYINNCPHYDRAPLGWKVDEFLNGAGDRIMCASHGALFRISDGVCEIGPCLGQSLKRIPLIVISGQIIATQLPQQIGHEETLANGRKHDKNHH